MYKNEIRQKYRLMRQMLSHDQCDKLSKSIFDRLKEIVDIANKNVGVFLPILDQKEPNTFILLSMYDTNNTKFYSPIVQRHNDEMIFYRIKADDEIRIGKFNIPESISNEKINCGDLNVILIPLLAFDIYGYRVGYGKGFYDKYLLNSPENLLKIGISLFDDPEVIDDINEFDIKMNYCISPNKIYQFEF